MLLAIKDHKNRAEVGYGLEPIIPDGYAGGVLRGIRPILRQGNYGGALLAAAQQIGQRIAQAKGVTLGGAGAAARNRPRSARTLDSVSAASCSACSSCCGCWAAAAGGGGGTRFPDRHDSR